MSTDSGWNSQYNPYGLQNGGSYVNPYILHLRKCKKKYPLACAYANDMKKKRACIKEYVKVGDEQQKKEPKKEQPKKEQPKKEQSENDDRIIKELRNYLIKNNIDATVEEILEKGYLKEYEKYNFVGEAVWEAMKHPCLKIGNNETMFTHLPKLRHYMDKDNYKNLKSKLKTIQQEINGAVFVLGLHPKECHDLPARQQLFEDYQLLFTDEVKQLWKSIYKKLNIPKISK